MMKGLRIAIGSDHAAVALKDGLVAELRLRGFAVEDLGTHGGDSVDYPDFAERVARRVVTGGADRGIALCGTGIGMSIAANKIPGIRAALCHDVTTARLARQHNDANVLCMGGRILGTAVASDVVMAWLDMEFEGGRHVRRIDKITQLDAARTENARGENPRKENG